MRRAEALGKLRTGINSDSVAWEIFTSYQGPDPITLQPTRRAPALSSGCHNWCGAAAAHANGDNYVVNGRYVRLTPDLEIVGERKLRSDNAHNGHVRAPDGNLITKDSRLSGWDTVASALSAMIAF